MSAPGRLLRLGVVVVAAALAAAAALIEVGPSDGAFPGANGLILYAGSVAGHEQLFTVRPDGTHARQLTRLRQSDAFDGEWSPDGGQVVFTRHWGKEPHDHFQVTFANADGSGLRTLKIKGRTFAPSWFPTGRRIAFGLPRSRGNGPAGAIGIVNVDGTNLRRIRIPGSRSFENGPYVVSPDGRLIAFVWHKRDGAPEALYVVRVRDGRFRRITSWSQDPADFIDWSPDGSRIVFSGPLHAAERGEASLNVFTIRPDGTGLRKLTHSRVGGVNNQAAAWSPDGTKIAFVRWGEQALYTLHADGTGVTRIAHGDVPVSWGSHP